jgi:hypothetical protein
VWYFSGLDYLESDLRGTFMLGEQLATALLCMVLAISDKRQQNKLIHPLGLEVTPQLVNRVIILVA